jgi:hypothetical protein
MVEGNLVRALAYLSELFEYALSRPFDLDDLDSEVVIDQIDYAGRHTTAALFALRPDIALLPPEDRGDILDVLFDEHDPAELDELGLLDVAWVELDQVTPSSEEVDAALAHLDVVNHVLDPDLLPRLIANASPEERVQLASQLECVELMLEEARDAVRGGALLN